MPSTKMRLSDSSVFWITIPWTRSSVFDFLLLESKSKREDVLIILFEISLNIDYCLSISGTSVGYFKL